MALPSVDPHAGQPVLRYGPSPSEARVSVILLHGRGDSAEGILGLAHSFEPTDVAYLAPQAMGYTWYPYSFLAPLEQNEPHLSSALRVVGSLVTGLCRQGVPPERIVIMGFSQGACLSLESAVRHPRKYAGVVALSGALIGPAGTPRNYQGSFGGMPIFVGCSDIDAHIPLERVEESADVFSRMGADVDKRIYLGMGHTINADELTAVNALLERTPGR
jgi:predicted esterase